MTIAERTLRHDLPLPATTALVVVDGMFVREWTIHVEILTSHQGGRLLEDIHTLTAVVKYTWTALDCIIYLPNVILYLMHRLLFHDRRVLSSMHASAGDGETCPRALWNFSQLIHLVLNLDIPPSDNSTGMISIIIPIAYLVVIFGGLYAFSVLYRRHIAGKFTYVMILSITNVKI